MQFLKFIISILLISIVIISEYVFGFWVSTAGIIGTVVAYFLYKSWDGKEENDWKLLITFFSTLFFMIILLINDQDVQVGLSKLINLIFN